MAIVACLRNCLTGSSLWGSVCFVAILLAHLLTDMFGHRLQRICVGQAKGCLAEQQGGPPRGCIALRSETADCWQGNNIYVDVCHFLNNFTRVACRDGTNRRLRLSLPSQKRARKARNSVRKRRGVPCVVESGFGIFHKMMGWMMHRHLDGRGDDDIYSYS